MNSVCAKLVATGSYLPENIVTNQFFNNKKFKIYKGQDEKGEPIWEKDNKGKIKEVDLSPGKTLQQTGVIVRHWAGENQTVYHIAKKTLECALLGNNFNLEALVCATVSHNRRFPSIACYLQNFLNARHVRYVLDISSADNVYKKALELACWVNNYDGYGPILVVDEGGLRKIMHQAVIRENDIRNICALVMLNSDRKEGFLKFKTTGNFIDINYISRPVPNEQSASAAAMIIRKYIHQLGMKTEDLRGIICAAATVNTRVPTVADYLKHSLDLNNIKYSVDVHAACSGSCYADDLADKLIRFGGFKTVASIGVEALSKLMDINTVNSNIFGDGGGCKIWQAGEEINSGLIASSFYSDAIDGRPYWLFSDKFNLVRMPEGPKILKLAIIRMIETAEDAICKAAERLNISIEDLKDRIKLIVPHQANVRIIDGVIKRFKCSGEIFREGISKYGNISAATIPIGYDKIFKASRINEKLILLNPGDAIVDTSFGGGLASGALVTVL